MSAWNTWLTRHRSIVPFHEPAAIPKRLTSLAAHKAHTVLAGKISLRFSVTSLHARTEAQIPSLYGKAMDWPPVGLWLSPCHPFFPFHLGKKQMMQESEWNADIGMNFAWKVVSISGALNFRKITFKATSLAENLQHWYWNQLTQCAVTTAEIQHPSKDLFFHTCVMELLVPTWHLLTLT